MFNRVLVIYKESNYEQYILKDHFLKLKKHKELSKPLLDAHRVHYESLDKVQKILEKLKIHYLMTVRNKTIDETHFDIVITVGGDGTFLDAAQYLEKIPIVGVNSHPKQSIGHFCGIKAEEFERFLHRRSFPVLNVSRLEVIIDRKRQRPVLNDVLIANIHPASTSRYRIEIGKKKEEQKSSGIWVSTSIGSTAAILGAGGRRLDKRGSKFQIKIREPYHQPGQKIKLDRVILNAKQKVKITSQMRDGMIYHDGTKRFQRFIFGSRVEISGTAPKLKILGF